MQPQPESTGFPRLRWWILLLLFLAIAINFLDRQVLSIVEPILREKYRFTDTDYGVILVFFLLGMTLGQVPAGIMLDRWGARRGFPLIFVGWSLVGMLHAWGRTVAQFCGLRFLLGLNECGSLSAGIKVIGEWFPARERALASGIFNAGCLAGSVIAPPIIVLIILHYGWRAAFLIPGAVGCLWVYPWLKLYWVPAKHPRLTPDQRAFMAAQTVPSVDPALHKPRIRSLLCLAPVWGVILMRAFGGPVNHFYWYWLPEYLKHERHMSLAMIGLVAGTPFISGGLGNIAGGWASSYLIRRGRPALSARKAIVAGAAVFCLLATLVPVVGSPASALALICLATFGNNAISANHMAVLTDTFPETMLARIAGMTGVGDGILSMAAMLLTGIVVQHYSYLPVFITVGLMPVLATLSLFLLVRAPDSPPVRTGGQPTIAMH